VSAPPLRAAGACVLLAWLSALAACSHSGKESCQAAEVTEKPEAHRHQHPMEMNTSSGVSAKCAPTFTYEDGPVGPGHWEGVCKVGHMQAPIDVRAVQEMSVPPLAAPEFSYQPADLDLVNDCNRYQLKARFPDNLWLKVARKPYRLSEIVFHAPAENAVNGQRAPMSLQLVHLSPEVSFLVIEVPVIAGKENPVIKTVLQHIPAGGKERVIPGVKLNAMDLLPADRGFYRFPGSLTTPVCNEGVTWLLMKSPIEMSAAQIAKFRKYYHNTARPLQALNGRPVVGSK
jgi:carbonic anhydrase